LKLIYKIIFLITLAYISACSIIINNPYLSSNNTDDSDRDKNQKEINFVIFGNTYPKSPFIGFPDLKKRIDSINSENPQFVIHIGNIIQGGTKWMGIKKQDIKRQYSYFKNYTDNLNVSLYTTPGKKDYYNKSLNIYKKNCSPLPYYSFNYGNLHAVILKSNDSSLIIDNIQFDWLLKDLIQYKNSNIFIFMYNSMIKKTWGKKIKIIKGERLHKLFKKYKIKGVISGERMEYINSIIDNIHYISAYCFNYPEHKKFYKSRYKDYFTYYKFSFSKNKIKIKGFEIK
jgi:hypothetical protein